MTLADLLIEYLATNPRIASTETGRRYRTVTNAITRHLGRPATVADLTADSYGRWVNARREEVAPNTLAGDAEKLLVLWRWAARRGLAIEPTVAVPKKQYRSPVAYTNDEIDAIWKAAHQCGWLVGNVPAAVYWPALIDTLYQTAERIQAVHSLTAADIDLDTGAVRFRAETRKGQQGDALRPVTATCAARVRELVAYSPQRPFAPVRYKTLYPAYRRLLAEAGVSLNRQKMFHAWRRRHASDLTAGGIDATVSLGHSSRAITTRSYIDPSVAMSRKPLETLRKWQGEKKRRNWLNWLTG